MLSQHIFMHFGVSFYPAVLRQTTLCFLSSIFTTSYTDKKSHEQKHARDQAEACSRKSIFPTICDK